MYLPCFAFPPPPGHRQTCGAKRFGGRARCPWRAAKVRRCSQRKGSLDLSRRARDSAPCLVACIGPGKHARYRDPAYLNQLIALYLSSPSFHSWFRGPSLLNMSSSETGKQKAMNVRQHQTASVRLQTPAWLVGGLALFLSGGGAFGQGNFQNLDFEQATVPPTPVNGYGDRVDPALAFPGWTVSASGNAYALYTLYNNLTLDAPAVDLIGPSFPNALGMSSLHGSYSVVLQYSDYFHIFPFISQTGLVPANAKSISFAVAPGTGFYDGPSMALGGVGIALVPIGGGRLAGDVTAFAGTLAKLEFSTGAYRVLFDDIRFSSLAVPEPTGVDLAALGALLLGWRVLGWRR